MHCLQLFVKLKGHKYLTKPSNYMFIGHFAVGMAAKQIKPTLSLGTLFLAAQFLDLLWPTLLLLGIEHVIISPGISKMTPLDFVDYPISHSLLVVIIWSLLFGVGFFLFTKNRTGALILAALVLSHWLLDLIVHIPDLPLYPGASPKVGLGMWNSPFLTVLIEGAIFIAGLVSYLHAKKKQDAASDLEVLEPYCFFDYRLRDEFYRASAAKCSHDCPSRSVAVAFCNMGLVGR